MSEGFMVKSRWGFKQHQPACTCGVCKSKRKEHLASLKSKVGETDTDSSSAASETSQNSQASLQAALPSPDAPDQSTDLPQEVELQPAETGNSDIENQKVSAYINGADVGHQDQVVSQLKKPALKVQSIVIMTSTCNVELLAVLLSMFDKATHLACW